MKTFLIIMNTLTAIVVWELCQYLWRKYFKEEPIKHYQPERHEYPKKSTDSEDSLEYALQSIQPKKDCECDCLGECQPGSTPYFTINPPTRYIGVYKHGKGWQARIKTKGVKTTIGTFDTESEAAHAYNNRAIELRGSKAKINHVIGI